MELKQMVLDIGKLQMIQTRIEMTNDLLSAEMDNVTGETGGTLGQDARASLLEILQESRRMIKEYDQRLARLVHILQDAPPDDPHAAN